MRQGVLLDCQKALFVRKDLPVVFLALVIKTEANALVIVTPHANDVVSGHVVDGPIHVSYFKEHSRKKPLLSGKGVLKVVVQVSEVTHTGSAVLFSEGIHVAHINLLACMLPTLTPKDFSVSACLREVSEHIDSHHLRLRRLLEAVRCAWER